MQRAEGLRGALQPVGCACCNAGRLSAGVLDPAVAPQFIQHRLGTRGIDRHRARQGRAAHEGFLADGSQQQPLGIVQARGAQRLFQRTLPGGYGINQGKDNRLAGFEGSWLHEWRLLFWFAATAMRWHPSHGYQGPEHGRPGRHGRRSLSGGARSTDGADTTRILCRHCDSAGMSYATTGI
ncbi:hypothetical protein CNECB9_5430017 [Cupriavidus necator]|uniref:Uncharacterized protein n=1 Tax=Cupriavidus necator TaxID=106590 RepID=A0A1K0IQ26_CUPNE|nr:hypothetical protein CNECB9_5430017 [Cupriavidus necator]